MLKAQGILKAYGTLPVLKGIDLEIKEAEVVSIVGASGAGKSTLLHVLGTLDHPDRGEIFLNDTSIFKLSQQKLAAFRNDHIGFIFQFHNLLPEFTALENVMIPGLIGVRSSKEVKRRALELLQMLGMLARKDHKPSELSGGEQQRVSVARALINDPSIVFADEPSGNLDSKNADELHNLFFKLRDELKQTFVIVTHNKDLAEMADRKLEIADGVIVA
ncbi:MAG: lipoprotein-releasing system ATP-binding protein LolD [Flammeovirgaceae bacterium]|nr:lipoprotein-releasing system ATP-binding protein LolD [Flammeovirgaceae bacterium]MBE60839.1 lipoprotein-releasing system ATP-binding protein LolD [Flammeovirgaceae bacterium]HCX23368.1 lipoprotein-releasing system ATP-binding protein LolD [Cytophagales bacterium]|tara:strand:+ start:1686 stop:2339 length:654 start_codon:yes stop_codon:yes gene_type:complete